VTNAASWQPTGPGRRRSNGLRLRIGGRVIECFRAGGNFAEFSMFESLKTMPRNGSSFSESWLSATGEPAAVGSIDSVWMAGNFPGAFSPSNNADANSDREPICQFSQHSAEKWMGFTRAGSRKQNAPAPEANRGGARLVDRSKNSRIARAVPKAAGNACPTGLQD